MEDEKHASFLDNRLLDGMEMAYILQRRRDPVAPVISHWFLPADNDADVETETGSEGTGEGGSVSGSRSEGIGGGGKYVSIFAPLYHCCIRPYRKRRVDYVLGLLRRCDLAIQNQRLWYHEHVVSVETGRTTASSGVGGRGGAHKRSSSSPRASTAQQSRRPRAQARVRRGEGGGGSGSSACFLTSQVRAVEALREERIRMRRAAAASVEQQQLDKVTNRQCDRNCLMRDIYFPFQYTPSAIK